MLTSETIDFFCLEFKTERIMIFIYKMRFGKNKLVD